MAQPKQHQLHHQQHQRRPDNIFTPDRAATRRATPMSISAVKRRLLPWYWFLVALTLTASVQVTTALYCYECDSSNHFSCTEFWDPSLVVSEQYYSNCSHVYNAQYCVKMTGIFDGKLGTKRFCSARDWGNYCEYIERPGDIQEYRSCVFTCSTLHGCNDARSQLFSGPRYLTLFPLFMVTAAACLS